jgi:hypothetical protein
VLGRGAQLIIVLPQKRIVPPVRKRDCRLAPHRPTVKTGPKNTQEATNANSPVPRDFFAPIPSLERPHITAHQLQFSAGPTPNPPARTVRECPRARRNNLVCTRFSADACNACSERSCSSRAFPSCSVPSFGGGGDAVTTFLLRDLNSASARIIHRMKPVRVGVMPCGRLKVLTSQKARYLRCSLTRLFRGKHSFSFAIKSSEFVAAGAILRSSFCRSASTSSSTWGNVKFRSCLGWDV